LPPRERQLGKPLLARKVKAGAKERDGLKQVDELRKDRLLERLFIVMPRAYRWRQPWQLL